VRLRLSVLTLHGAIVPVRTVSELCRSVSESEGRRHLRSSGRSQLVVPRYSLATVGRRALGYAGPKAWNSLPGYLRCGDLSLETFKRQLKTFLFAHYWRIQRIRGSSNDSALYKLTFIIYY